MLSFFRKNDPYLILSLVLILIGTRVFFAFMAMDSSSIQSDPIEFLKVDENGNGPIGLWLDGLISTLPSESIFSIILAGLLVLLNAIQLNTLFIRNSSIKENTYVPAALFIFLMSASGDFYYFSPALLASSLVIFSLNYLFYHIKYRGTEENILSTGFGIGLAGLIYTPFLWLYLFILISYLIYSNTIRRRYFLMSWGFLLPIIVYWLFFFWRDQGSEALSVLGEQLISFNVIHVSLEKNVVSLGFGLLLSLAGFVKLYGSQGKTNHQILVEKAMSWNALFAILIAVLHTGDTLDNEILAIPSMAYFSTQLILNIDRKWLRESLFGLYFVLALLSVFLGY